MYQRYIKRLLDIFISVLALILLSPIFVVLIILIRLKLGYPVIFKQQRVGFNERVFIIYKFRTMSDKRDINGDLLPDCERLTSFGKMLRFTSLDELPELWNIFKGDMSIVGPRPLLARYLPYYKEAERIRHSVRPGLTGLSQINGRNNTNWDTRLNFDINYVKNISPKNDIKIILITILKVLKSKDIINNITSMKDFDEERGKPYDS